MKRNLHDHDVDDGLTDADEMRRLQDEQKPPDDKENE